ncbi:hypothetical protein CES86_3073 [Brucella lupini]|jgi:hypothetical protein|uniref:Uncharacterized protein n=1 Tax=Brucella lupini TaxID=255457 RepID=A0A256GLN7_9HYPH|nr:hypothetical protein CES86_3073 [Brucella lupini]
MEVPEANARYRASSVYSRLELTPKADRDLSDSLSALYVSDFRPVVLAKLLRTFARHA